VKNRPAVPLGVQLAMARVPPGRQTRSSSPAAAPWSAANIAPTLDSTTSKAPVSNGRSSAEPGTQSIRRPSAAAARSPTAISSGVGSTAVTAAPVRAAGRVALPEPAPTSRTRRPARTPAASTSAGPRSAMSRDTAW
jgi:hypothetical protein